MYSVKCSVQYKEKCTVQASVQVIVQGQAYFRRGMKGSCSSQNKAYQRANMTTGYGLFYSSVYIAVYSSVYSTLYHVVFSKLQACRPWQTFLTPWQTFQTPLQTFLTPWQHFLTPWQTFLTPWQAFLNCISKNNQGTFATGKIWQNIKLRLFGVCFWQK